MPLSKAKQAEWMREYRKRIRYNVIPKMQEHVIPKQPDKLEPLRTLIKNIETGKKSSVIPSVIPKQEEFIPWYNPAKHKQGDKVRMWENFAHVRIVIVPEVDADGLAVFM